MQKLFITAILVAAIAIFAQGCTNNKTLPRKCGDKEWENSNY